MTSRLLVLLLLLSPGLQAAEPQNFLFMGAGDLAEHEKLISRPDIAGVQIVYSWKSLEGARGVSHATNSSTSRRTISV